MASRKRIGLACKVIGAVERDIGAADASAGGSRTALLLPRRGRRWRGWQLADLPAGQHASQHPGQPQSLQPATDSTSQTATFPEATRGPRMASRSNALPLGSLLARTSDGGGIADLTQTLGDPLWGTWWRRGGSRAAHANCAAAAGLFRSLSSAAKNADLRQAGVTGIASEASGNPPSDGRVVASCAALNSEAGPSLDQLLEELLPPAPTTAPAGVVRKTGSNRSNATGGSIGDESGSTSTRGSVPDSGRGPRRGTAASAQTPEQMPPTLRRVLPALEARYPHDGDPLDRLKARVAYILLGWAGKGALRSGSYKLGFLCYDTVISKVLDSIMARNSDRTAWLLQQLSADPLFHVSRTTNPAPGSARVYLRLAVLQEFRHLTPAEEEATLAAAGAEMQQVPALMHQFSPEMQQNIANKPDEASGKARLLRLHSAGHASGPSSALASLPAKPPPPLSKLLVSVDRHFPPDGRLVDRVKNIAAKALLRAAASGEQPGLELSELAGAVEAMWLQQSTCGAQEDQSFSKETPAANVILAILRDEPAFLCKGARMELLVSVLDPARYYVTASEAAAGSAAAAQLASAPQAAASADGAVAAAVERAAAQGITGIRDFPSKLPPSLTPLLSLVDKRFPFSDGIGSGAWVCNATARLLLQAQDIQAPGDNSSQRPLVLLSELESYLQGKLLAAAQRGDSAQGPPAVDILRHLENDFHFEVTPVPSGALGVRLRPHWADPDTPSTPPHLGHLLPAIDARFPPGRSTDDWLRNRAARVVLGVQDHGDPLGFRQLCLQLLSRAGKEGRRDVKPSLQVLALAATLCQDALFRPPAAVNLPDHAPPRLNLDVLSPALEGVSLAELAATEVPAAAAAAGRKAAAAGATRVHTATLLRPGPDGWPRLVSVSLAVPTAPPAPLAPLAKLVQKRYTPTRIREYLLKRQAAITLLCMAGREEFQATGVQVVDHYLKKALPAYPDMYLCNTPGERLAALLQGDPLFTFPPAPPTTLSYPRLRLSLLDSRLSDDGQLVAPAPAQPRHAAAMPEAAASQVPIAATSAMPDLRPSGPSAEAPLQPASIAATAGTETATAAASSRAAAPLAVEPELVSSTAADSAEPPPEPPASGVAGQLSRAAARMLGAAARRPKSPQAEGLAAAFGGREQQQQQQQQQQRCAPQPGRASPGADSGAEGGGGKPLEQEAKIRLRAQVPSGVSMATADGSDAVPAGGMRPMPAQPLRSPNPVSLAPGAAATPAAFADAPSQPAPDATSFAELGLLAETGADVGADAAYLAAADPAAMAQARAAAVRHSEAVYPAAAADTDAGTAAGAAGTAAGAAGAAGPSFAGYFARLKRRLIAGMAEHGEASHAARSEGVVAAGEATLRVPMSMASGFLLSAQQELLASPGPESTPTRPFSMWRLVAADPWFAVLPRPVSGPEREALAPGASRENDLVLRLDRLRRAAEAGEVADPRTPWEIKAERDSTPLPPEQVASVLVGLSPERIAAYLERRSTPGNGATSDNGPLSRQDAIMELLRRLSAPRPSESCMPADTPGGAPTNAEVRPWLFPSSLGSLRLQGGGMAARPGDAGLASPVTAVGEQVQAGGGGGDGPDAEGVQLFLRGEGVEGAPAAACGAVAATGPPQDTVGVASPAGDSGGDARGRGGDGGGGEGEGGKPGAIKASEDSLVAPAPVRVVLISNANDFRMKSLLAHTSDSSYVALDCEMSRGRLSMIQILAPSHGSRPRTAYLVDLEAARTIRNQRDLVRALAPLLTDPRVIKVLHGGKADAEVLRRFGIRLGPYVDTQRVYAVLAAAEAGAQQLTTRHLESVDRIGLGALLRSVGLRLEHKEAFKAKYASDPEFWSRRPLTQAMIQYAVEDVSPLLDTYRAMLRHLLRAPPPFLTYPAAPAEGAAAEGERQG